MSNLNQTNVTLSGRRQGGKSHLVDKNATIHQNIFSHTKLLLEILFFFILHLQYHLSRNPPEVSGKSELTGGQRRTLSTVFWQILWLAIAIKLRSGFAPPTPRIEIYQRVSSFHAVRAISRLNILSLGSTLCAKQAGIARGLKSWANI